jgi:hypothetical protein
MPTHVISANGTEADPTTGDVQVAIYQRKVILTDAEIKGLPTTPVEIVPAPGAGKVLNVLQVSLLINNVAGQYTITNTDDGFIALFYSTGSGWDEVASERLMDSVSLMNTLTLLTTFLTTPMNNRMVVLGPYRNNAYGNPFGGTGDGAFLSQPTTLNILAGVNKGLYLIAENADENYGGGNAANTLSVTIMYSIVDL